MSRRRLIRTPSKHGAPVQESLLRVIGGSSDRGPGAGIAGVTNTHKGAPSPVIAKISTTLRWRSALRYSGVDCTARHCSALPLLR